MRDTNGQDGSKTITESESFVKDIRHLHSDSRISFIDELYNRPRYELVDSFLVEMDAKNKAYFFILENDLFSQFRDYCLKSV